VRGILNDLTESGLVLRSGRGDDTHYRAATEEELRDLGTAAEVPSQDADAALVWLQVYRAGPVSKAQLAQLVPLSVAAIDAAVQALLGDQRIAAESRADGVYFTTDECLIPIGEAVGWEAAVVDHHRAVLNALAAKIASGSRVSAKSDEVGGTTLTFELWPGHPREAEVRRLLATTRAQVISLWEDVAEYNRQQSERDGYQVHFYCGQYLVTEEDQE
jgi:hypothetical protein